MAEDEFAEFKARLTALLKAAHATEPQAKRPPTLAALLAAVEVSGGWAEPMETARRVATLYQSLVVGVLKLDPSTMPAALKLHAEVTQHIGEVVAALEAPGAAN